MKSNYEEFRKLKKDYLIFLKRNKIFKKSNIFFYENTIEKMKNWTNIDFKKTVMWYEKIRRFNKAKVSNIHLEKMKKWTYNKKKRNFVSQ